MEMYYNPLNRLCKSIIGGVQQNQSIHLKVFGKEESQNEPCFLVLRKDGGEAQTLPMKSMPDGWEINISLPDPGLYYYFFKFKNLYGGCGKFRNIDFQECLTDCYQILIYDEKFHTPDWFKGGIMYQIFPDRFYKSGEVVVGQDKILHKNWTDKPMYRPNEYGKILNNDFFGGNIQGIIDKLDYLQSLHVTILYLNPIFEAYSNHRYDTGDYNKIDPILGTEEDFARLTEECSRRNIKIMLDGVFNHTGDDSRYFNKYGKYNEIGAYQSKDSKYYDWYTFDKYPERYSSWWGIKTLPAVNELCPSYIDFITGENGVLRHWMKYNIAGYRLDVADELPDEFIEKIHDTIKQTDPNAIVLGEVWEDASCKIAYGKRRAYFQGDELDSVMNYPLKNAIINFVTTGKTSEFREIMAMLRDNYPKQVLDSLMNILGTHDTARILTALDPEYTYLKTKDEMSIYRMSSQSRHIAIERLKVAALLLFTLPGVPCIYYGDEIGMEGYADPFCRGPFEWNSIDSEILSFYQTLSEIRSGLQVFKTSDYIELFADENCIVFKRQTDIETAIICVNMGNNKYTLSFKDFGLFELFSKEYYYNKFTILPHSISILSNKSL